MNPFLLIPACYVGAAILIANLQALAAVSWYWTEVA
jgi:hypothetical protein